MAKQLLGCVALVLGVQTIGLARSPNFVVILADDLGAGELGCYGHLQHRTPNLDRLAQEGMRFRTCYSTPNCSPTRVMLMTGRYGFRTGWFDFIEREYSPLPGSPQFDIGAAEITFADVVKQRGYATGIAGKWQLPGSPESRIYDCGFDTYCMWTWKHQLPATAGGDRAAYDPRQSLHSHAKTGRYWDPGVMLDGRQLPTGPDDYGPDIFSKFVIDYIGKHRDEPFLMYYPMVLVHPPWEAAPVVGQPGRKSQPGLLQPNVAYLDHLVGQVCLAIDDAGLRENTYVIFTGDNGTAGAGKGEVTERGVRVPLIVRGPGIRAGAVSDELADLTDILPTIAELAGASLPADRTIDGVSLAAALFESPGTHREWIFSYLGDERMLRDKRWLLEGDGAFYDCGELRDGQGYRDVTGSKQPEVREARRRFKQILKRLPGPANASSVQAQ